MAGEITENYSVKANKNSSNVGGTFSDTIDMSGTAMFQGPITATTSWVQLPLPAAMSGATHVTVRNNDAANYVELAVDSGGTYIFAKLLAGEFQPIKRIPALPYIRANTASCACFVVAFQQ